MYGAPGWQAGEHGSQVVLPGVQASMPPAQISVMSQAATTWQE